MHYPDLGHESQIAAGDNVRAVGWLSAEFPFSQGVVPPEFIPALRLLIRRGWVPMAAAGSHACEFCTTHPYRDSANVLVPAEQTLYVAPAMIVHYAEAHSYRPPEEFLRAVRECPLPGTAAYEARLTSFLGCWSEFVPLQDLQAALREHCAEQAALAAHFAMFDGPGASDPPWYVSVVGGLEGSQMAIAKVFAARWRVSDATALERVRAGDTVLGFADIAEAEHWAARLQAAGAELRVWNGGRTP